MRGSSVSSYRPVDFGLGGTAEDPAGIFSPSDAGEFRRQFRGEAQYHKHDQGGDPE